MDTVFCESFVASRSSEIAEHFGCGMLYCFAIRVMGEVLTSFHDHTRPLRVSQLACHFSVGCVSNEVLNNHSRHSLLLSPHGAHCVHNGESSVTCGSLR